MFTYNVFILKGMLGLIVRCSHYKSTKTELILRFKIFNKPMIYTLNQCYRIKVLSQYNMELLSSTYFPPLCLDFVETWINRYLR